MGHDSTWVDTTLCVYQAGSGSTYPLACVCAVMGLLWFDGLHLRMDLRYAHLQLSILL